MLLQRLSGAGRLFLPPWSPEPLLHVPDADPGAASRQAAPTAFVLPQDKETT